MTSPNAALSGLLDASSFYSVPDALGSNGVPGMQAAPQAQQGPTAPLNIPSYLQPGSILNPTDPALNTLSGAQIASMVNAANNAPAVPSPSAYLNFPTTGNTPTYSQLAGLPINPADGAINSPLGVSTLAGLAGHKPISVTAGSVTGGSNETKVALDDVLRALDHMKVLVGRMEQLLAEQAKAQAAVFESAQSQGGSSEVMGLQTEYVSLLAALQSLASSHLVGALPVPLASTRAPISGDATDAEAGAGVTMADLTSWAEDRAGLEFARKEAVRSASKAVLDVLRKQR